MSDTRTENDETTANQAIKALLFGVGLTALWIVLGFWRPETTYHLAPLLIGVAPAGFAAGTVTRNSAVALGIVGLTLALVGFGVLATIPGLDGPTIGPFTSASQETVSLAIAGAVIGGVYAAYLSRA